MTTTRGLLVVLRLSISWLGAMKIKRLGGVMPKLDRLNGTIIACNKCPRLEHWREASAQNPPRRHLEEQYWAKPLPGFGDSKERLRIVGLAPAAYARQVMMRSRRRKTLEALVAT